MGFTVELIEPVSDFIATLQEYFNSYGLISQLDEVKCASVEEFKSKNLYDFVIAEGFIHALGKPDYWLPLLLSFVQEEMVCLLID